MLNDFLRVYEETTIKHRGCVIHKVFFAGKVVGFSYNNRHYFTLLEAIEQIDNNLSSLEKSIAK